MDPITIAMLGLKGVGLVQSLLGQKKQTKLAEAQAAREMMIQQQQLQLQRELQRQGVATQIDAHGNVTAYDEASNTWKTVLAPNQQKIQDLSDVEQTNQLAIDAPMSRIEGIVNATRRSKEGTVADGVRANISDLLTNPVRGSDVASSMRLAREKAVNAGFDQVSSRLGTQALRSGATGGAAIAGILAKQRAQAIDQTMGNPDLEGMSYADEINNNRLSTQSSLYGLLANRASGAPNVSFGPTNVGSSMASVLANARGAAGNANGQAGNLLAQAAAGVRGMTTPDYATGSGQLANSLAELLAGYKMPTKAPKKETVKTGNDWNDSWGGS